MLGSRRGVKVAESLYQDSVPDPNSGEGMGLFVRGGNPLFRNSHPTQAGGHSIMGESVYGIGGHHLVLSIAPDPDRANAPYLFVKKAPLSYARAISGSSLDQHELYVQSNLSTPLSDWYKDLNPLMRAEAARALLLYPLDTTATSQKWSCPMRRLSFWSGVDDDKFSPLSPSPPRAARLFGGTRNLNFNTRSHPTMLFESIHSYLPKLYTSNGFCICRTMTAICRRDKTVACGLHDTVASLQVKTPPPSVYNPSTISIQP